VGCEASVFRPLTRQEDEELVDRISHSEAGLVFLGLGCPLQEIFAHDHRQLIRAVQICVGAAFDFHGGHKKMAPAWLQENGLEWLYRLSQEPRRLWRRYLVTNSIFLIKIFSQLIHQGMGK
jgi:exopolysaccharide biosynthesis WecB/TagA/CpsF family protein